MSGVSVVKTNGGQTSAIFANDTRWRPNSQILHRRDRSNSRVTETARPSGVLMREHIVLPASYPMDKNVPAPLASIRFHPPRSVQRLSPILDIFSLDSFMSCLHSLLGYSTGEFQALQLVVLEAFGAVD